MSRPGLQTKEDEKGEEAHEAGQGAGRKTALHETDADYFAGGGEGRNGLTAADTLIETHGASIATESEKQVVSNREAAYEVNGSDTQLETNGCVFALSFTESGRHGTLWSVRTVHKRTNYFALMRLMQDIEKRQRNGEPLAANIPNLPKKTEKSAVSKLAFRYSVEVEDLYSIKYSSETVDRLAAFYGLSVRDIRHIKSADIPDGE